MIRVMVNVGYFFHCPGLGMSRLGSTRINVQTLDSPDFPHKQEYKFEVIDRSKVCNSNDLFLILQTCHTSSLQPVCFLQVMCSYSYCSKSSSQKSRGFLKFQDGRSLETCYNLGVIMQLCARSGPRNMVPSFKSGTVPSTTKSDFVEWDTRESS